MRQALQNQNSNDFIFDLLMKEDEITWQSIIHELVKTEQMDPWDVDLSILSEKYIGTLKKIQQMDLRLSGKVVLAAALLLKIKSDRFLGEDIAYFDNIISGNDDLDLEEDSLTEPQERITKKDLDRLRLIPKTPQPRLRKVSIYDLVEALQKALEVKKRRNLLNSAEAKMQMQLPEKKIDITKLIQDIYLSIKDFFEKDEQITFTKLINGSDKREDKIYTFIPLLHLTNQRKIDLEQQTHFGEISVVKPIID